MTTNEKRQSSATSSSAVLLCYSMPNEVSTEPAAVYSGTTRQGLTMPTLDQLLPSRFLKQSDVPAPVLVTISGFTKEVIEKSTGETKWCLHFREFEKPLAMNPTNLKRLAVITGKTNSDDWIGQKVVLYTDPTIEFAGDIVGGLRLRAPNKPKAVAVQEESEWAGEGVAELEEDQRP